MTAPVEVTAIEERDPEDDLVHHWCCDRTVALCGTPLREAWVDEDATCGPEHCAMCVEVIKSGVECSPGCFERMDSL